MLFFFIKIKYIEIFISVKGGFDFLMFSRVLLGNLYCFFFRIESGVYNKIEDMYDVRKGRINVCIIFLNILILLVVIFIKIEYFLI